MLLPVLMMPFALEACTWAFNVVGGWARMEEVGRRLQDSDPDSDIWAMIANFILVFVIIALVETFALVLFMIMYKNNVTQMRQPMPMGLQHAAQSGDFVTGECSCFEDMNTCLHGCCFPMCRVGDTYEAAGVNTYYGVICTFIVLGFVMGIVTIAISAVMTAILQPGDDIAAVQNASSISQNMSQLARVVIFGGVFTQYRRQLRIKLGGRDEAVPFIKDFLCWGCCTQCVICQEARELDKAMGVQVACCCKLIQVGAPAAIPMVGQAVMMAPGQAPMPGQMMQGQMMQGQMVQGQQG